jgi:putative N-acetylmannosamine-6-phosphate epimerase
MEIQKVLPQGLVGFTSYSQPVSLPHFELVERLVKFSPVPVIVEGHVSTPEDEKLRRGFLRS